MSQRNSKILWVIMGAILGRHQRKKLPKNVYFRQHTKGEKKFAWNYLSLFKAYTHFYVM